MSKRVLIIGGDSFIGSQLNASLVSFGYKTICTSRNPNKTFGKNLVFLDMTQPEKFNYEGNISAAIFCASVTSRKYCQSEPILSRAINVSAVLTIAEKLMLEGVHCIFLSTNMVLGGEKNFLVAESVRRPYDTYSRQKSEAEISLSELRFSEDNLSILRLTKVLNPLSSFFVLWSKNAIENKTISAFSDISFAPILAQEVCEVIGKLVESRALGIFQLSGSKEMTYSQLAEEFLEFGNFDGSLLSPNEGLRELSKLGDVPPHCSLSYTQTMKSLGLYKIAHKKVIEIFLTQLIESYQKNDL